jgi:hypothetical protein
VVLLLQVFLHKVFILETFMVQRFCEVLSELLFEVTQVYCLLVAQELKLVCEGLLQSHHILALQNFAVSEVLVVDSFSKLLIPVESQWI